VKRGFALLEVLVALAIIAVALPALMLRMQSILGNAQRNEEKTYAYWLADNTLQELQLDQKLGRPVSGIRRGKKKEDFAGHDWYVDVQVEEVPLPEELLPARMYRVNIGVGPNEDKTLVKLSGYMSE